MRFLYLVKSKIFFRIRRKRRLRSESQRTKRVQSSYEKKWTKILVCQGLLSANQLPFKKVSNLKLKFLPIRVPDGRSSSSKACVRAAADQSSWSLSSVLCPALSVCPAFSLKFRLTLCWITLNWWIYFVLGQQVFYSSLNKTLHASSFFQSIFNYVWTRISFLIQPISLAPFKF